MTDVNTQRAIGRLEGQVGGLKEQIENLAKAIHEQGDRQQQSQTRLYRRLDEQAEVVAATTRRLGSVETKMSTIEPIAKDFAQLKQRGYGAMAVIMLIWVLLGGAITQGASFVWAWAVAQITRGA